MSSSSGNTSVQTPDRLRCNGRSAIESSQILDEHRLYRGYTARDLHPETGTIEANSIPLPDTSCNWELHSLPEDVRLRTSSSFHDGCYSILVRNARKGDFAEVVHDPICDCADNPIIHENYSHVEIRTRLADDPPGSPPPRGRKKPSKTARAEWRKNLALTLRIEFPPVVA
jgi:hypothetical protein